MNYLDVDLFAITSLPYNIMNDSFNCQNVFLKKLWCHEVQVALTTTNIKFTYLILSWCSFIMHMHMMSSLPWHYRMITTRFFGSNQLWSWHCLLSLYTSNFERINQEWHIKINLKVNIYAIKVCMAPISCHVILNNTEHYLCENVSIDASVYNS